MTLELEDNLTYLPWNPSIRVRVIGPKDLLDVGRCSTAFELVRCEDGQVCNVIGDLSVSEFFTTYILPYLIALPAHQRNSVSSQKQVARAVISRILTVGMDAYDGVTFRSKNVQLVVLPQAV